MDFNFYITCYITAKLYDVRVNASGIIFSDDLLYTLLILSIIKCKDEIMISLDYIH